MCLWVVLDWIAPSHWDRKWFDREVQVSLFRLCPEAFSCNPQSTLNVSRQFGYFVACYLGRASMWGSTWSSVPFREPILGPQLLRPCRHGSHVWMVHSAQISSLLSWHDYCIKFRPWCARGRSYHSHLCLFFPSLNVWVYFKDLWLVSNCPIVTSSCAHSLLPHLGEFSITWRGLSQWGCGCGPWLDGLQTSRPAMVLEERKNSAS